MRNLDPKLKPQKDWKFRVIICDDQGNAEWDDTNNPMALGECARKLIPALLEKREHGEAVPEEKD